MFTRTAVALFFLLPLALLAATSGLAPAPPVAAARQQRCEKELQAQAEKFAVERRELTSQSEAFRVEVKMLTDKIAEQDRNGERRLSALRREYEGKLATEKGRADRLQGELDKLNPQLATSRRELATAQQQLELRNQALDEMSLRLNAMSDAERARPEAALALIREYQERLEQSGAAVVEATGPDGRLIVSRDLVIGTLELEPLITAKVNDSFRLKATFKPRPVFKQSSAVADGATWLLRLEYDPGNKFKVDYSAEHNSGADQTREVNLSGGEEVWVWDVQPLKSFGEQKADVNVLVGYRTKDEKRDPARIAGQPLLVKELLTPSLFARLRLVQGEPDVLPRRSLDDSRHHRVLPRHPQATTRGADRASSITGTGTQSRAGDQCAGTHRRLARHVRESAQDEMPFSFSRAETRVPLSETQRRTLPLSWRRVLQGVTGWERVFPSPLAQMTGARGPDT